MRLKKVNNNTEVKNYKININLSSYFKNNFCVGDTVQNKEDKTIGIIDKIKNGVIFVKYKDGTVERINELNAKDNIEFAEVEFTEPTVKETKSTKHKKVITHALQDIDFTENSPIDKFAEQQYNALKEQSDKNNKDITIKNIVNLGIQKGIIDKDEFDLEVLKASSMTDEDFENYKDEIVNFNSQSIVSSNMQEEEEENLSEAELMLRRVKSGNIETAGNVDFSSVHSDTRDLSAIKRNNPIQEIGKVNQKPVIQPVIAPAPATQNFDKYAWMSEINWNMGNRN